MTRTTIHNFKLFKDNNYNRSSYYIKSLDRFQDNVRFSIFEHIIWRYSTIQNKTFFYNLQKIMNHWKYLYLLNYSKICLHILLLNAESTDGFKFTSFSIKNIPHFSFQFNCKINIILILDFQCFKLLYFKISDQSPNLMNFEPCFKSPKTGFNWTPTKSWNIEYFKWNNPYLGRGIIWF